MEETDVLHVSDAAQWQCDGKHGTRRKEAGELWGGLGFRHWQRGAGGLTPSEA